MQYMKKMLQRLVPHIKSQFLSPSKQIIRTEAHQSRQRAIENLKIPKTIGVWSISPSLIVLNP